MKRRARFSIGSLIKGCQQVFQDPGFPLFEAQDSGFDIFGRVSGLKVCLGDGTPKITLGITELHETLGRDYGIEERYRGPSKLKYARDT